MSNSLRDEVKDAIVGVLQKGSPNLTSQHYEKAAEIADAVFGVMGITEDIQDMAVKPLSYYSDIEGEVIFQWNSKKR